MRPRAPDDGRLPLVRRLMWFVGLWAAGVVAVAAASGLIILLMGR